ncbi:hypothetical protein GCM10011390_32460 [Aureimonas endophytica]|uniref:Diguanylate cyclase (GGDEF)-like protein n=1 Tax=Aureimonas endophytica TaxID=2027858 RepID=A0A916ZRR4_9HYPH|nr:bifunctional diguanylate cyclase/phosphodiesterase [Aureimonas endophytica]GGE10923.1 hypothetical protein GCM10011390_32460 [Aureimonas endophytica]
MREDFLLDPHHQHEAFGRITAVTRLAAIYGTFGETDPQTGLANRKGLDAALRRLDTEPARRVALIVLDIDHLRIVNETEGRPAGDAVLRTIARRLAEAPKLAAFRTGSDEFTLLLDDCAVPEQLEAAAAAILDALMVAEAGAAASLPKVTMGGALGGDGPCDPRRLLREANLALCYAKEHARGDFLAYRPGMRRAFARTNSVAERVGRALNEGRIVPFYQPLVDTRTARIIGVEALVRLQTRRNGIVGPQDFSDALRHPLLGLRITDAMLRRIAADVAAWLAAGIPFKHVGVNLAPADLLDPKLETRLAEAFGRAGVSLRHVVLEITETTYLGRTGGDVSNAIRRLREQGFLVALDDFGTGYASLTHLLDLPVDIIKIDRSFVERLPADPASHAVVSGLVAIAKNLGMRVVAEGIERLEQAELLTGIGVELGQGFLFSPAVDAARMTELLHRFSATGMVHPRRRVAGLPVGVC